MATDFSTSAGPAGLYDRNATPPQLPSGSVTGTGTTGGTTGGTQSTGGATSSAGVSNTQNMTPTAQAALEQLIQSLSDHPAVSDAAATLQLQQQGLKPPTFSSTSSGRAGTGMSGTGDPGTVIKATDEMGRPIYTQAEFAAAQARYSAAKTQLVAAGGIVAGGTPATQAQKAMHDSLVTALATEHATNVAATAVANTKNADAQVQILTAYADNIQKAAANYDTNKSIVENANATNRTQNDAAFQTYLANTVTADADHQRAILQNAEDRAIVQANLARSQGLQDQNLAATRVLEASYSKDAAFNDAKSLTAGFARKLAETIMPSILRATEASGTSGSATTGLLANDAAARVAEEAATVGMNAAGQYGQINANLLATSSSSIANSPTLQKVDPVTGIQQIAPVNPLNPGLVQPVQQIAAPTPLVSQVTNDQTTAALTNLVTAGANPALDALLASLGISKGAVTNNQQAQTGSTKQTQATTGTTAGTTTDNKVQTGTQPPVSPALVQQSGQVQYATSPVAQPANSSAGGTMSITPTTKTSVDPNAQPVEDPWANYSYFPAGT